MCWPPDSYGHMTLNAQITSGAPQSFLTEKFYFFFFFFLHLTVTKLG